MNFQNFLHSQRIRIVLVIVPPAAEPALRRGEALRRHVLQQDDGGAVGGVLRVAPHQILARPEDGSVFSRGSGADRQLAHADEQDRFVPTRVNPAIFADPQLNDAQIIDGEAP